MSDKELFPLTPSQAAALVANLMPTLRGYDVTGVAYCVVTRAHVNLHCEACGAPFAPFEPYLDVALNDRMHRYPWHRYACLDLEACAFRCSVRTES